MKSLKLIGTVLFSFALAAPAMAIHQRRDHRAGHDLPANDTLRYLPVQDAVHFGFSSGRCGYHSGYGGLYGDGLYPGSVCVDGESHLLD